jgi:hypothetical protein
MGKVHRIKKSFAKVVAVRPWETIPRGSVKTYGLVTGRGVIGLVRIYIGVRWDGSVYIGQWGDSYKGLVRELINESSILSMRQG